jgi:hypothetical protein
MDKKEKSLIEYYVSKFLDNTFDEKDVYAFLILIRNQSKGIKCINELADFIAHRDKNKGFIKEYLQKTKYTLDNLGKINTVMEIKEVFTFKEIKNGINKVLVDCGFNKLSNEKINDFITCLISILQHVRIYDNKKEIGRLYFAISKKQIILMGIVKVVQDGVKKGEAAFPVLTAKNNYIDIQKQDEYDTPYLFKDDVIEVRNQNRALIIGIPNYSNK